MSNLNQVLENAIQKLGELSLFAAFTSRINLIIKSLPPYKGKTEGETHPQSGLIWSKNVWMTSDAQSSFEEPPKNFGKVSLNKIDVDIVKSNLEKLKGNFEIKSHLPKLKELSDKFYDENKDTELLNTIKNEWRKIQDKNKEAIISREAILTELKAILPENICSKIKAVFLRASSSSEAIAIVEKALIASSEVKKPEDKKEETPELDKDKKEFNLKDREYLINLIKKQKIQDVAELIKKLKNLFNMDLINELLLASKTYGGMPGILEYLHDYKNKKRHLKQGPAIIHPRSEMPDLSTPTKEIIETINKIKELKPRNYYDSYFKYTEDVLDLLNQYQRGHERVPEIENELLGLIMKLKKGWGKLKIKEAIEPLDKIRVTLFDSVKHIEKIDEHKKHPLLDKIKELEKREKIPSMKEDDEGNGVDKKILDLIEEKKQDLLKKTKSSLERLSQEYKSSTSGKLEKLIEATEDLVIKGELGDILSILKLNS